MSARHLKINLSAQTLVVFDGDAELRRYAISSAANGAGEIINSECTPRGRHIIRAKIGAGAQANTVFIGRRPTGEIFQPAMRAADPNRDWIVTRILWLSGCEVGKNRLGEVDTMRRYIYIHGTPDDVAMGATGSRGCIRMRNADVVELFELATVGMRVEIDQ